METNLKCFLKQLTGKIFLYLTSNPKGKAERIGMIFKQGTAKDEVKSQVIPWVKGEMWAYE